MPNHHPSTDPGHDPTDDQRMCPQFVAEHGPGPRVHDPGFGPWLPLNLFRQAPKN